MDFKFYADKSRPVLKMSITLKVGIDFDRKFGIETLMKIMYKLKESRFLEMHSFYPK